MTYIYLNEASAICPLGTTLESINEALFSATTSPLTLTNQYTPGRPKPVGQVFDFKHRADTRINTLLLNAIEPLRTPVEALKQEYSSHSIGVIIGSSTSGIAEGEVAMATYQRTGSLPENFHYQQQEINAPAAFVASQLEINGPAWTVSTACTSSAKALASAARLLKIGAVDAVICGGADSLCRLTAAGFDSLLTCSNEVCLPFSYNRSGINIGEAATLFVMSKKPSNVRLLSYAETSDAHHVSAPDPEGLGAQTAIETALQRAEITPSDIGYINLHGTGTLQNDKMESLAVTRVFGHDTPCSSTKPLTGHTLGAAGALEALFCWLTLQQPEQKLPPHLWDKVVDPDLPALNALGHGRAIVRYAMSNSFAFGGNNISLILEHCLD